MSARERALRLFCTTSAIFPSEWATQLVVEQTTIDVSEFAYHARRAIYLCDLRKTHFDSVDQTRFGLTPGQGINFITDLHEALNRLHHVKEMAFDWSIWEGEKIFLASPRNFVASFVRVSTDNREVANISLFGVALSFLNTVIPAVRDKFPDYQF